MCENPCLDIVLLHYVLKNIYLIVLMCTVYCRMNPFNNFLTERSKCSEIRLTNATALSSEQMAFQYLHIVQTCVKME